MPSPYLNFLIAYLSIEIYFIFIATVNINFKYTAVFISPFTTDIINTINVITTS